MEVGVQFKFGIKALPAALDPALQTGCLSMCPTAASRSSLKQTINETQCPQVNGALSFSYGDVNGSTN